MSETERVSAAVRLLEENQKLLDLLQRQFEGLAGLRGRHPEDLVADVAARYSDAQIDVIEARRLLERVAPQVLAGRAGDAARPGGARRVRDQDRRLPVKLPPWRQGG